MYSTQQILFLRFKRLLLILRLPRWCATPSYPPAARGGQQRRPYVSCFGFALLGGN